MYNKIIKGDCIKEMETLPDGSVDAIITDPPYKYLKNQKLEVDFCETSFFEQANRVLKKDGFIVLFGRGTSFYRWNVALADLGFLFKEEFVWDKVRQSSPALKISRVHETISVHAKGKGKINKVKIPYLEMREHNLDSLAVDVKRIKSSLNNTKSLDAMLLFLEENKNRFDLGMKKRYSNLTINDGIANRVDVSAGVLNSVVNGMNEKSIIRSDFGEVGEMPLATCNHGGLNNGMRELTLLQSMADGMNEKSIITQLQTDYYTSVHPTQKPVRLMERLIQIVTNEGDLVLDPFAGSGATALASINLKRRFLAYEIDDEYFNNAQIRINETQTKLNSQLF